jgi:hypothetical protein
MGLTTVEIKVNFLAPTQKGKLVAKGRCIRLGKTLALGDAEIRNNEGGWWLMERHDDGGPRPETPGHENLPRVGEKEFDREVANK